MYLAAGSLEKIQAENQQIDLERMEILQAEPTAESAKQSLVKKTVIPGWIYRGKVIQKAKVVAYRYMEDCVCQG